MTSTTSSSRSTSAPSTIPSTPTSSPSNGHTQDGHTIKSKAPLTLRPATRADLPVLASIISAAFMDFELYDHFLPHRRTQAAQFYRYLLLRLRGLYARNDHRFIVAEMLTSRPVPSTGDAATAAQPELSVTSAQMSIVAFAVWEAMGPRNPLADKWRGESYDAGGSSTSPRSWTSLPSFVSSLAEPHLLGLEHHYRRFMLNRLCDYTALAHIRQLLHHNFDALDAFLHLQFLITHPAHQGTGAGSELLGQGLGVARQWGLPCVLESSLKGWRFYERRGFRVVKMIRVGAGEGEVEVEGMAKGYEMPVLLWEPDGREGLWVEGDGRGGWKLKESLGQVIVGGEEENLL